MSYLIFAFVLLYAVAFTNSQIMAGGRMDQNPNDPEYMEKAWKAAKTLNEDSAANSGPYVMRPIKVSVECRNLNIGILRKYGR
ncbi:unnamed protein product [Strongylus vulgaris]|uniref:Cystatin domain-containing protein n=1 Tax=Strongylus vulgaris TaxID=40348 RepID=A0A3P7JJY0_STRVU|nr:unnamed protein product [Strongylus vulgaris]